MFDDPTLLAAVQSTARAVVAARGTAGYTKALKRHTLAVNRYMGCPMPVWHAMRIVRRRNEDARLLRIEDRRLAL